MHFLTKDRIGGLLLLAFCIAYGLLSQQIRLLPFQQNVAFHARTMPEVLTVLGIGLSLVVIVFGKRQSGETPRPFSEAFAGYQWLKVGLFLGLMSLYGLTIRPAGFLLSTSLFLIIGYMLLGERRPVRLLLASVPMVVLFWLLMTKGLDVFIEPLPAPFKGML